MNVTQSQLAFSPSDASQPHESDSAVEALRAKYRAAVAPTLLKHGFMPPERHPDYGPAIAHYREFQAAAAALGVKP